MRNKNIIRTLCIALVIAAIFSTFTFVNAATDAFTDVPADSWFANAVTEAVEHGYIKGMGDGRFAPYDDLTYAQVFSMVINAQYENDEKSFRTSGDNALTIRKAFNGDVPWWGEYAYFLNAKGLLDGTITNNNITVRAVVESKVSRYEMVQIIYNVLKDKGVNIPESAKTNANGKITDWSKVPGKCQTAVAVGYNLGIISGFEDGSFGGTGILTRAQSCVIINKTLDVIKNGAGTGGGTTDPGTKPEPETPVEPEPKPGTETEIKVTEANGAYTVISNGFSTGTLNNGLPATEKNVIALLEKAEGIWPTGIIWTDSGAVNNHWYFNPGGVTLGVLMNNYRINANYGCGGFAAMISDYLFGQSSNPARQTTVDKIRPGDIIVIMNNNGTSNHVTIATSEFIKDGIYAGRVWTADGNINSKVGWPDDYSTPRILADGTYWMVYTRYPD